MNHIVLDSKLFFEYVFCDTIFFFSLGGGG